MNGTTATDRGPCAAGAIQSVLDRTVEPAVRGPTDRHNAGTAGTTDQTDYPPYPRSYRVPPPVEITRPT